MNTSGKALAPYRSALLVATVLLAMMACVLACAKPAQAGTNLNMGMIEVGVEIKEFLFSSNSAGGYDVPGSGNCTVDYTLDWGDGSPVESYHLPPRTLIHPGHVYTQAGTYTINIIATSVIPSNPQYDNCGTPSFWTRHDHLVVKPRDPTISANKKFISPNEEVTFKAVHSDGTPANSNWSGGGTPKTGTGATFTTRFNVSPGFQGLNETVTAKAVNGGTTATGDVKVLKPSGAVWASQYPGDNHIAALAQAFQDNVQGFNTALANAGAPRHISAVYRPPERAHLMFYARKIGVDGMDPRKVPTPYCTIKNTTDGPIYVAWADYKTDGTYDASASINAAKAMLGPQGYNIETRPVAHPSRHEIRRAIDWNISWNGTLKMAWGPNGGPNGEKAGTIDTISTGPTDGLNHELWKVGASYGVIKFESVNKTKDAPHWSDTGH